MGVAFLFSSSLEREERTATRPEFQASRERIKPIPWYGQTVPAKKARALTQRMGEARIRWIIRKLRGGYSQDIKDWRHWTEW